MREDDPWYVPPATFNHGRAFLICLLIIIAMGLLSNFIPDPLQ